MSATLPFGVIAQAERRQSGVELFAKAALAFAVFLGGFVIFEPAPYELIMAATLGLWFIAGLRFRRSILPLIATSFLYSAGGILAVTQMEFMSEGLLYIVVTFFLALTSIFFASVISDNMGRLRIIFRAYVVAAVITSTLGILGYFGAVPGFEIFTRYNRAMGAFQDPNVFGPFLVAPAVYLIYGLINRSLSLAPVRAGMLVIILLGIFLAFSRAAWGLTIIATGLMYLILFVNEQQAKQRLKYIILAVLGVAAVVLLLVIALQFDAISSLFTERAKVVQNYDGNRLGRFARHWIGFGMAVETPLGLGPLAFGRIFGEETHNIWLKSLMGYGWLGFASFIALTLWTLISGFKLLFRPRPWQPYFIIAYSVYIGHTLIGWVIDIDHWRHYYLMIGIIWGCIALENRWQRSKQTSYPRQETPVLSASQNFEPADRMPKPAMPDLSFRDRVRAVQ